MTSDDVYSERHHSNKKEFENIPLSYFGGPESEEILESLELAALRKGNPEEYKKRIQEDPQRKWLMNRIYSP